MAFVEAIISHSSVHENEPCLLRRQSSTTFFKLTQTVNAKRFRTEKFDDFYEKHEEIGQGHFADVYRVKEKSTGTEYAAKYIKKKRLESSRRGVSKKDIQNEVNNIVSNNLARECKKAGIFALFMEDLLTK